jgi:exosome complex component RRP40
VDVRGGTAGGGGGGGSEASASLPALAFEGATRRSRPSLRAGDAVFCRVSQAQRHVESELTCVDEAGRAAGLGPLGPGVVVEVTTAHARALLAATAAAAAASPEKKASSSSSSAPGTSSSVSPIVAALAATGLPFEVAVGINGRVWVGGPDAAAVSAAARALEASDGVFDAAEAEGIARRAVEAVRAAGGAR